MATAARRLLANKAKREGKRRWKKKKKKLKKKKEKRRRREFGLVIRAPIALRIAGAKGEKEEEERREIGRLKRWGERERERERKCLDVVVYSAT